MSVEENKAIARRLFEEGVFKGDLAVVDETIATDFVNHSSIFGATPDQEGLKQEVTLLRTGFPDLQGTIEDLFSEGDKVVVRVTGRGTHTGELMGIPPTGKQINVTAISIFRLAGGKVVERWNVTDQLAMLRQIGVIPTPGQG